MSKRKVHCYSNTICQSVYFLVVGEISNLYAELGKCSCHRFSDADKKKKLIEGWRKRHESKILWEVKVTGVCRCSKNNRKSLIVVGATVVAL